MVLVTGADITADLVRETAAEVLPKQRFNSAACGRSGKTTNAGAVDVVRTAPVATRFQPASPGWNRGGWALIPFGGCGGVRYAARLHAGMVEDGPVSDARDLLRRLAANDQATLKMVLAPSSIDGSPATRSLSMLDRRTRVLVHLAALLVLDASTESLRWATDLASTSGADDGALAAVLVAAGFVAGSAQLVAIAPRLALAMDLEPAEAH